MNEELRIFHINTNATMIMEKLLLDFENEVLDEDTFLSDTYARLVTAKLLGFSPIALSEAAEEAAERIINAADEMENETKPG
jgi:hypothetical protein